MFSFVQACVLYDLFHGKIFLRVAPFGFRFCQGKYTVFDQRVYITFIQYDTDAILRYSAISFFDLGVTQKSKRQGYIHQ